MHIKQHINVLIAILKEFFRRCHTLDVNVEELSKKEKFNIAATLIVKNEKMYMREWIEYHRIIGVEHFFIYDNESTDNLREFLDSYIKQGIVSYAFVKGSKKQMPCYEDSVARNGKRVKWMAFLDADEFINIHSNCSLLEFLKPYEKFSGIGINWISFDSNNHEHMPQHGFILSNYTRCYLRPNDYAPNKHVKSIVKPHHVKCFYSPHAPEIKPSFRSTQYIVTENFEKITEALTAKNSTKKIQINHYFSKSKEEYIKKISRGRADNGAIREINKSDYIFDEGELTQSPPPAAIVILQKTIPNTYSS